MSNPNETPDGTEAMARTLSAYDQRERSKQLAQMATALMAGLYSNAAFNDNLKEAIAAKWAVNGARALMAELQNEPA